MLTVQPDKQKSINELTKIFKPDPIRLFVASVAIIFVAEAIVMLLIYLLDLHAYFFIGLVDAFFLSILVVPALYLLLLKPMRESIIRLDKTEEIKKQLVELDQLKSDFVSIATHELCSPVTTIMGYTEMLIEDIEPDRRKEFCEIILQKTKSLERIIDDLSTLHCLKSGKSLVINKTENDLIKTVHTVCEIYRSRFPDILLNLDSSEVTFSLFYDEVRIRQVLDNVLSNAVKYTQNCSKQILISILTERNKVVIQIKDEGIGMTSDELEKVYDKFFRAKTAEGDVGGVGLGMSIVKDIVDSHNGTINIASEKNIGTTVTISLPK